MPNGSYPVNKKKMNSKWFKFEKKMCFDSGDKIKMFYGHYFIKCDVHLELYK